MFNVAYHVWDAYDSYGRLALQLSKHLREMGHHVNAFGQDAPNEIVKITLGGVMMGYPTRFEDYPQFMHLGKRIAVTMWESTIVPDGWVDSLNQMDAISVPSTFVKDVFVANGIVAPIYLQLLGINEEFTALDPKLRRRSDRPIKFLTFADRNLRKGWTLAIQAFLKAFGDSKDVQLTIKSRKLGSILDNIVVKNENMTVINEDYDHEQMAQLFHDHDVLIFPTYGEGFGLTPREFAATGGIAMATNWGGTADDIEHWGVPINDYEMDVAWSYREDWSGKLGCWAKVNTDSLAQQLTRIVNYFDEYAQSAMHSAQYVREQYQWSDFAKSIAETWEQLA